MEMSVLQIVLFLIAGILLLYFGGEALVRGAASLALRLGISELIVGMTIVAMGTSAPEFFVSLFAVKESPGITIGNIVGSNIANIGLALALGAILKPVIAEKGVFKREIPYMLIASIAMLVLTFDRDVNVLDGVFFMVMMIAFIIYCIINAKKANENDSSDVTSILKSPFYDFIFIVFGLAGLSFGSDLFVDGARGLALKLGVSDFLIGKTVVAVGTSLPEVATLIISALRGRSGIAIGTVLGSNIFNILLVLGVAGIGFPTIPIESPNYILDLIIMLAFAFIIIPLSYTKKRLYRWEGILLLIGYIAFIIYTICQ